MSLLNKLSTVTSSKLQRNKRLYSSYTGIIEEIGQVTNLTELEIRGNRLTSLPPEIGQLSKLTKLNLSKNQLIALLPEIGQLTNL